MCCSKKTRNSVAVCYAMLCCAPVSKYGRRSYAGIQKSFRGGLTSSHVESFFPRVPKLFRMTDRMLSK